MVSFNGMFNANDVEPDVPYEPLPTGWYAMAIVASELKKSKNLAQGPTPDTVVQNQYLQLDLEIHAPYHPELKKRTATARLNIWNVNAKACEIAQAQLSAICRAVGVMQVTDSSALHFKPMACRLVFKPASGGFPAGNDVKGFAALAEKFTQDGKRIRSAEDDAMMSAGGGGGGSASAPPFGVPAMAAGTKAASSQGGATQARAAMPAEAPPWATKPAADAAAPSPG